MKTAVLSLLLSSLATAGASAQCTVGISNVPDIDQRRSTLPGDGDMYCAPTAVVNWAAYMANHGLPQAMSGPRDFQSQSNYAYATSVLTLVGALMNTDPIDGTSGNGMYNGAKLYFLLYAPGKVSVTVRWVGNGSLPSPFDMSIDVALGRMVSLCYARYSPMGGTYQRSGGHCVSLTKVINACSEEPSVWIRDPATDKDYFSQSAFLTKSTRLTLENVTTDSYGTRNLWRLLDLGTTSSTRRYIDSLLVLHPNFVVTKDPAGNSWTLNNVIQLTGSGIPSKQSFKTPNGKNILAMGISPDLQSLAYITDPVAGVAAVFVQSLGDGVARPLITLSDPTPCIEYDRFGHLLVCDRTLRMYDIDDRTPVLKHQVVPANPVADLDYDDSTDQVVVLEPAARRLVLYNANLASPISKPLPTGLPLGRSPFFGIGSTPGQYFIASPDDARIFETKLAPDGSGRLVMGDTISLREVVRPEGLRVTNEGTLVIVDSGRTLELEKDARTGDWRVKPDSDFDDLPAIGDPIVSRSRTNFDPRIHDGPAFINIIDTEVVELPEFVECPCIADFNASGGTPDTEDIDAFFSGWLLGIQAADADCSGGTPDTEDINTFFLHWLAGGC
jgi:hypothetical protein